jgi:hypothetical protein
MSMTTGGDYWMTADTFRFEPRTVPRVQQPFALAPGAHWLA